MSVKDTEKRLLEMQGQFARQQDPEKKAAIRRDYIDLHRRWIAAKSQLTLGGIA